MSSFDEQAFRKEGASGVRNCSQISSCEKGAFCCCCTHILTLGTQFKTAETPLIVARTECDYLFPF